MAGRVKTRLAEYLGDEKACEFYRATLTHVFGNADPDMSVFIASADADRVELFSDVLREAGIDDARSDWSVFVQRGEDLGERMACAFEDALARLTAAEIPNSKAASETSSEPQERVFLLTGTDIPFYEGDVVDQAVAALAGHDAVLGPTPDGGYYLIGLRESVVRRSDLLRRIFADIPWSTARVRELQTRRLEDENLRTAFAPQLQDVDTVEDLLALSVQPESADGAGARHVKYLERIRALLPDVRVVLPILNESENLKFVLGPIFESGYAREVICADNGSTDGSREIAAGLGARVTLCEERGYGITCLTALDDIRERGGCDVVLFMDGDGADDPRYIREILAPVCSNRFDLSLGARVPELALPGALMAHARFGNWLITRLVKLLWKFDYRDLGPFRAVRWQAYETMRMDDRNYGWTVQMQIRILQHGLRVREMPVPYRKRHAGTSKVTASLRGSYMAGKIIFRTLFREYLFAGRSARPGGKSEG